MWHFLLFLFYIPLCANGSVMDEMAEATQLCCNQGLFYARNHTDENCSSITPPPVHPTFVQMCTIAMDRCCKEFMEIITDCNSGIEIATSEKSCASTKDSVKKCCNQCVSGEEAGHKGMKACEVSVDENNAEQLLISDAFVNCCKNAATDGAAKSAKSRPHSRLSSISTDKHLSTMPSVCEEYAPNELCAHHCIPIPGSYKCQCNDGFMLMSDGQNCKAVTKNRCKPRNPCQHKCNDNGKEVKCSCRRGYQLMADEKSCEDIDECTLDPPVCLPSTQCFNIQGSYKCIPVKSQKNNLEKGQCPPGFARNFLNNACDDINECSLPKPPCPIYICENTIGGYKCGGVSGDPAKLNNKPKPIIYDRCPSGFRNGVNEECEDIDECLLGQDDCNELSQFCINTRGSFYCQDKGSKHCPPGFMTNTLTNKCEDINECEDGEDICRPDQMCVNILGEYDCKPKFESRKMHIKCPDGMRFNPMFKKCDDIDECVDGTHLCDQYQNCLNTNGSYECHCKLGFEHDSTTGACVDINECATEQNNCYPESQRCDNTIGSYLCIRLLSCGTGYIIQYASGQCEDIDECALGTHNCDRAGPQYQCFNIPGSFRCQKRITSSTAAPVSEYEIEYYDSEEEIEKSSNKTVSDSNTTTTSFPLITSTQSTPVATTGFISSTQGPKQNIPIRKSNDTTIPTVENRDYKDNDFDFNAIDVPDTSNPSVVKPQPPNEFKPTEPTLLIPYEPVPKYVPTESTKTLQTTTELGEPVVVTSMPKETTSPKLVVLKSSEETATVSGHKTNDGSVIVDTKKLPKHEWTKINTKPTDCQMGFEMDAYGACYDIDECATNRHSCSGLTELCRNTMGGYLCDCANGFRRDFTTGACTLIITSSTTTSTRKPRITIPVTSSTTSSTTTSSTTTSTTMRTTTSTTSKAPAPTTSSTPNYFWGYPEQKITSRPFRPRNNCDVGFYFNSITGICEDVNECTNGQATCASVEICINTEGGYRCECSPNWIFDSHRNRCVPDSIEGKFPPGYGNLPVNPINIIPETKGTQTIDIEPNIPVNEDRGSVYKCPRGTRLGDDTTCEDIDECSTGEAQCGPLQICTNLLRGYTCSCPSGHKSVGDHACADVDECSLGGRIPVCSPDADCINTIGSYQCQCHDGFRSAPVNDEVCVDVDECTDSRPGELCQQRCNNVRGGYRCSCHRGYRLNSDNRTCSDVDECTEFKHKNLCIGYCLNEPGSFKCSCPPGYRLSDDKRSCIDIDECETGEAPCAAGGQYEGSSDVCINKRGGYKCQRIICPTGYKLESRHRCTKSQAYCPLADWQCSHQPITYSYNFITFVSNLYIPESKVDLFTMRGPSWPNEKTKFQLRINEVDAPPSVKDKANINAFLLIQSGNKAVMSLVRPLEGPQSIELELSMELYSREQFEGIAVAKIFIYVSEYEF